MRLEVLKTAAVSTVIKCVTLLTLVENANSMEENLTPFSEYKIL